MKKRVCSIATLVLIMVTIALSLTACGPTITGGTAYNFDEFANNYARAGKHKYDNINKKWTKESIGTDKNGYQLMSSEMNNYDSLTVGVKNSFVTSKHKLVGITFTVKADVNCIMHFEIWGRKKQDGSKVPVFIPIEANVWQRQDVSVSAHEEILVSFEIDVLMSEFTDLSSSTFNLSTTNINVNEDGEESTADGTIKYDRTYTNPEVNWIISNLTMVIDRV